MNASARVRPSGWAEAGKFVGFSLRGAQDPPYAENVPSTTEKAEPLGRREQNRIDTRRAIADAAFELARSVGPGAFTVDQIAARAGVSRRTFFNYFHSAEDALTVRTDGFLELALEVFGREPQDRSLFDSIIRSFTQTTRMEGLSQAANSSASTAESADDSGEQLEARVLASLTMSLTMLRDGFAQPAVDPAAGPEADGAAHPTAGPNLAGRRHRVR